MVYVIVSPHYLQNCDVAYISRGADVLWIPRNNKETRPDEDVFFKV
jgi:hypothetical protein